MPTFYSPLVPEAAEQSRQLQDGCQLWPPADFPALFTCKLLEVSAIGCVFRNGIVIIVPDHIKPPPWQTVYTNMKAVDDDPTVTDIVWEWQVTRRVVEDTR